MRRKKFSIRAGESFSEMIRPVTEDIFRAAMPDGSMLLIDGDGRAVDAAVMPLVLLLQ